ncbi:uncharacterized protein L201_006954 [Kwoniella dendrophila CBS 6074]|uniref:Uncharacterized protein n=1 Tax=Kwoniella dendrophila CBS 6074 TaxID=1295534 RepID=A0AAX4K5F2_9TREE
MVLVGLLPLLAFAGSIQAAAIPVDSPPPSPALGGSVHGSATFSPIPTFSPQLNVPSPTLPSSLSFPSPSETSLPSFLNGNGDFKHSENHNGRFNQDGLTNTNNFRSNGGVGRGKGMTNAERMKRGLGILPPTRRMTSKPVRKSAKPVIDASQFDNSNSNNNNDDTTTNNNNDNSANDNPGDPSVVSTPNDGSLAETSVPSNTNDQDNINNSPDNNDNNNGATNSSLQDGSNGDDDDGTANPGNGNVLASKKYAMRMMNPDDGSDMGLVTGPDDNSNPLVGYSPSGDSPIQMSMPTDPTSTPFSIVPGNNDNSDNNGNDGDDSTFQGPRKVLAAVPHRTNSNNPNSGDLVPGNGNYAPLGMGWTDNNGLLHIDLKAIVNNPSSLSQGGLPVDPSNLPTDNDGNTFGVPKQLLSRPGGSVLPITPSSSNLPVDPSQLGSATNDPTNLLHATLSNLPLGSDGSNPLDSFGNPQSTLWTFHPNSQRLLAHYVNSDGNTVPTYFVTGGDCQHTLCLTADVKAFKDAQGADAHEVHVLAEAIADL